MYALLMGLRSLSPQALNRMVISKTANTFDVNSSQSWMKAHVPGATNLSPAAFTMTDLPLDKTATVVFYCSNYLCRKAPSAARRAMSMGYQDVRVMSAGISGWLNSNLPVERSRTDVIT